jgi:Protein of unknown function (DUF1674)
MTSITRRTLVYPLLSLHLPRLYSTHRSQKLPPSAAPPFTEPVPAPPRLSPEEQAEFERLQREANEANLKAPDEMHPDARKKTLPDFEGERNPVTGEVGGPKTEPTKYGDWSYGGRTSDF